MVKRNAVSSVLQTIISAFIMFFLYRSVLDALGPAQLGVWSIVLATVSSTRIAEFGLSAGVTRFIAKYNAREDYDAVCKVIQTGCLSIFFIVSVVSFFAHIILPQLFSRVIDIEYISNAEEILPYALLSLIFNSTSIIFQSGIDGCMRYDYRAILVIFCQFIYLLAALHLMPEYGLLGLAYAQIIQGLTLLIFGWLILRKIVYKLPLIPYKFSIGIFKEMFFFGVQFQIGSIAMMLFDPLAKVLLGKYAGVSSVGYYDMASQLVGKVRALIVSANQILIPLVASNQETDTNKVVTMYMTNMRVLVLVLFPLFGLLFAWIPLVSEVWLGEANQQFIKFCYILIIIWCLNTLNVPAYFSNIGAGRIAWNTYGHIMAGFINLLFGYALGDMFGENGVLVSISLSLVLGSILIIIGFHKDNNLSMKYIFPEGYSELIFFSLSSGVSGMYIFKYIEDVPAMYIYGMIIIIPSSLIFIGLIANPAHREILKSLLSR